MPEKVKDFFAWSENDKSGNLHKIIKIVMIIVLLLMAYFLPGICAGQTEKQNTEMKEFAHKKQGKNTKILQNKEENGSDSAEDSDPIKDSASTEEDAPSENSTRLIVIDPGHGGYDPGMIGVGGVEEKHINLQVSKKLGELLEKQGFEVVYTRTKDVGLYDEDTENKKTQDMRRRCALIEEKDPVLTVSIHQNSYSDAGVCGPQVFYYEASSEGKMLASCVQEQLNTQLQIPQTRDIKGNTNYYILKRSKGTTILVECSFLSNPREAEEIQTEEYQQAVAQAICSGIMEFLKGK